MKKKKKMKRLPKGVKKYIRQEKARIRKQHLKRGEEKKLIDELYSRFS